MTDESHAITNGANINRRDLLVASALSAIAVPLAYGQAARVVEESGPRWISTKQGAEWTDLSDKLNLVGGWHGNVMVKTDEPFQTIDGFGACFNELGWDALNLLPATLREQVFADFFAPYGSDRFGLGFTHCRMPVAANDFARDWYSYNETPGDFAMEHFSIDRDRTSLIPYIKAAKVHQPELKIWGSPWSPPTWMKTNGHYAQRPDARVNDLGPEGAVEEGADGFILKEEYFRAYALYFRKYIEAYRGEGLDIHMVMPQNEFNSNQNFPSCVWTPESLAEFVGYLAEEMDPLGIDIFLGTIERPDPNLFHRIMENQKARETVKGLGFQWAGRHAAPFLHYDYPELKIYQTEQECGDGKNDWRFARHSWRMMKDYMRAGTSVYEYWNMALVAGEPSSWGWRQNSLVTVDRQARSFNFTPDYYTLKHVCHFVQPGARHVNAHSWTGHENALAFLNPNGSEVMVIGNDLPASMPVEIGIRGGIAQVELPPNSLNTIAI